MKPYYEDQWVKIYLGDAREVLPTLPLVDMVLTDPPYGIKNGIFWRRNGDGLENWKNEGHNLEVEGWRLLAADRLAEGAFIEFCSAAFERLFDVCDGHRAAGLELWTRYLIVKSSPAPTVRPTFASAFEEAVISTKGKRRWYGGGYTPNRWIGQTPNNSRDGWGHPTEKPIEPLRALVAALTQENDVILDPFCGSATTCRAAKDAGRRSIGIEVDEKYCEISAKRMSQDVLWSVMQEELITA